MIKTVLQVQNAEILEDINGRGRARPWRRYKMANEYLSMAYEEIDERKALRLRECASWLGFGVDSAGKKKLAQANFCRVRLCPMCQWRRSLKHYNYTRRIVSAMVDEYRKKGVNLRWLMVTLTVKSCRGEELSRVLDEMQESWYRLVRTPEMNHVVGWYRALEVTHDCNQYITAGMYAQRKDHYDKRGLKAGDENPNFDAFHPHYHVLIAVSDKYARISYERTRRRWALSWMGAARLDYMPQVDVRRSYKRGQASSADGVGAMVAEVAKYTCKPGDYILPDDWNLTVDTVRLLDKALHNRRFVAYGKACKEWHKKLNLEDVDSDSADLIGEGEEDGEKVDQAIIYAWSPGYKQYIAQG